MSRPLLVLRPEPGNSATLTRARELGLEAIGFPLFAIAPRAWDAPPPTDFAGILFTSANGVRHAGPGLAPYLHLPVYAVGEATAEAARGAGFASVVAGDRDVERVIALVATLGTQSLLHLSGAEARSFDPLGIKIVHRVVYETVPVDPDTGWAEALAAYPVALVHSPRAAARFAQLAADRARIALIAISGQAAAAAGPGWEEVAIADEPRDEAMLGLATRLCGPLLGD